MSEESKGFIARARSIATSAVSRGKAAALLVVKQAERTKITTMNLPGAYQALGKHVFTSGGFRADFANIYEHIERFLNEIKAVQTPAANELKAQGLTAKVKAAANATRDAAHIQSLKTKANHALSELGKAAFDKYGEQSGPDQVARPIADWLSRIQLLDAEIAELSRGQPGQIITPKRLVFGAVAVIALMLGWFGYSVLLNGTSLPKESGEFANVDYTKGPNGERLEKIWREFTDKNGTWFLEDCGYSDKDGTFKGHGWRVAWYVKPTRFSFGSKKGVMHCYAGYRHGKEIAYYKNGQKELEETFKQDKLDGEQTTWTEKGAISSIAHYRDGIRHGVTRCNYEDGTPKNEVNYVDGEQGRVIRWNNKGQVIVDTEYIGGLPKPTFNTSQHSKAEFVKKLEEIMPTITCNPGKPRTISGPLSFWQETFSETPMQLFQFINGRNGTMTYECADGSLRLQFVMSRDKDTGVEQINVRVVE